MMKDADLKRNASGYYDETAYKAITAPPKAGEIWTNKDGTKCWLILQNNGPACSTLLLGKEEKENSIKVMGRVPMYTNPVMIGYTFTVYISTFVKTVPADKMAEVQKAVGEALGITAVSENPLDDPNLMKADVKALSDRLVGLQIVNDDLKHMNVDLEKENEKLRIELKARNLACDALDANCSTVTAELEKALIYKELYMDLIDKLVCARGGCRQ